MIQFYGEVKKEQHNYPEAIKELRETLEEEQPELEQYLIELWDNQQREITAQQYIEMVKKGKVTKEIEKQLLQSTSIFVLGKMLDKKQSAMEKGAEKIVKKITERQSSFSFDIKYHETKKWIEKSCAEQIVHLTKTQKEAIKLVIDRAERLGITTEGTADLLKPMIGLHKGQVTANVNYYNSIKQNLLENHTKMKEQAAEQKALEKAKQYAKNQKEYRAMTIARTELAGAYNAGEYYSIKQAQKEGLMGKVKKYAISAGDGRVCKGCREVEGQEVNQNEYFKTQWGDVLFPPFHTSCRCAVEYEEISEPEEVTPKIPEITAIDTQQNDSYSTSDEADNFIDRMIGRISGKDKEFIESRLKEFDKGLETMQNETVKKLLIEAKNDVKFVRWNEKGSKFKEKSNIILLGQDATASTIAHELFHKIDHTYGVSRSGILTSVIQEDYRNLQRTSKFYGISIENMLYLKYTHIFRKENKVTEPYRGISDILHGMSKGKIFLGYGHTKKDYWKKPFRVEKETWAQYGRMIYMQNEDVWIVTNSIFPNITEQVNVILKEFERGLK